MKSNNRLLSLHHLRRSREGAWIEIMSMIIAYMTILVVAPARERGLKLLIIFYCLFLVNSRSREGAWIEIIVI